MKKSQPKKLYYTKPCVKMAHFEINFFNTNNGFFDQILLAGTDCQCPPEPICLPCTPTYHGGGCC